MQETQENQETWLDPWIRKIPWKRAWQHTPVSLSGECHGQRSLVGYSPWGSKRQTPLRQLAAPNAPPLEKYVTVWAPCWYEVHCGVSYWLIEHSTLNWAASNGSHLFSHIFSEAGVQSWLSCVLCTAKIKLPTPKSHLRPHYVSWFSICVTAHMVVGKIQLFMGCWSERFRFLAVFCPQLLCG